MDTSAMAGGARTAGAGAAATGRDRRVDERFDLESAPGTLIHKGVSIPCEMVDLSLSGCSLRVRQPFTAGALESVKVVLSIHEMVLSIWGVTQWTRSDRHIGIRFIHPTGRTRNQLAGLLTCLLDGSAAEFVKQAIAEAGSQTGTPILALEHPVAPEPGPRIEEPPEAEEDFQVVPAEPVAPARPRLQSEHKVLSLEVGDSPAMLHLVAEQASMAGHVVEVSQDGCLLRLGKPLAARINAQAEVDFHLQGLPFRLPGTTKELHDERVLEIRFTEMSRRKRDDLSQAILELIEKAKAAAGGETKA